MYYIGIDPGLDGAIAVLDIEGQIMSVEDTSTYLIEQKNGKQRRDYNITQMVSFIRKIHTTRGYEAAHAAIEYVHAMPKQGVVSMFRMGYGLGLWAGIVAGNHLPMTWVSPQDWQNGMLRGRARGKDANRQRASELWPTKAHLFARKRDDGRADACLIAEYLRRIEMGVKNETVTH